MLYLMALTFAFEMSPQLEMCTTFHLQAQKENGKINAASANRSIIGYTHSCHGTTSIFLTYAQEDPPWTFS